MKTKIEKSVDARYARLKPTRTTKVGTFTVETWYDRKTRSYVTQTKDADGCQLETADYAGNKDAAITDHDDAVKTATERMPHRVAIAHGVEKATVWADREQFKDIIGGKI